MDKLLCREAVFFHWDGGVILVIRFFSGLMVFVKQQRLKIVVVMVFCVCTVWFFNGYSRYRETGSELLANGWFQDGLAQWLASGDGVVMDAESGGGLKLMASDVLQSVSVGQSVASVAPGSLLRLACDVKTLNVVGGGKSWETARMTLISFDGAHRPMYERPHTLFQLTGNHDWGHIEKIFAIGADVAKIEVKAQLARSSGELWVRGCSLRQVTLKPDFRRYRLMLLSAGLVVLIWVAAPFLRSGLDSRAHGAASILAVGILLGVLMPEELKETLGALIWPGGDVAFTAQEFNDAQVFGLELAWPALNVFKVGHFVMFALLAMTLVTCNPYGVSSGWLVFCLCLFATASEVAQLFMTGRNPQLGDIIIDCMGIACGLILGIIIGLRAWANPRDGAVAFRPER